MQIKKLCKPNLSNVKNSVSFFTIDLLAVYGECGGNFFVCTHNYEICNDDKKEC